MTDATKVKEATPDMFIAGGIAIAKALEAQKDDPEATLVDVAVACWDAMRAALPSPAALDPVSVEAELAKEKESNGKLLDLIDDILGREKRTK